MASNEFSAEKYLSPLSKPPGSPRRPAEVCEVRAVGPLGPLLLLRMARALLISLASCLLVVNQAFIVRRCDLAKVLHEEQLDGFEGYSLSDCECHFSATFPVSPLLFMPSSHLPVFLSSFQAKFKKHTPYTSFLTLLFTGRLLIEHLLCTKNCLVL